MSRNNHRIHRSPLILPPGLARQVPREDPEIEEQRERQLLQQQQQLQEHWQRVAMLLLWKLSEARSVIITSEDMDAFKQEFEPDMPFLLTRGLEEAFEIKLVKREEAEAVAAQAGVQVPPAQRATDS